MLVRKTCHKQEQLPRSSSHRCVCAASELTVMLPQPSCWRRCVADIASDSTIAQQVTRLRHQTHIITQTQMHQRRLRSRSHLHIDGRHGKLTSRNEVTSFNETCTRNSTRIASTFHASGCQHARAHMFTWDCVLDGELIGRNADSPSLGSERSSKEWTSSKAKCGL